VTKQNLAQAQVKMKKALSLFAIVVLAYTIKPKK